MKHRVWTVDEIQGILLAANQASSMATGALSPRDLEAAAHYRQGFVSALVALALAFGLSPQQAIYPDAQTAGLVHRATLASRR